MAVIASLQYFAHPRNLLYFLRSSEKRDSSGQQCLASPHGMSHTGKGKGIQDLQPLILGFFQGSWLPWASVCLPVKNRQLQSSSKERKGGEARQGTVALLVTLERWNAFAPFFVIFLGLSSVGLGVLLPVRIFLWGSISTILCLFSSPAGPQELAWFQSGLNSVFFFFSSIPVKSVKE